VVLLDRVRDVPGAGFARRRLGVLLGTVGMFGGAQLALEEAVQSSLDCGDRRLETLALEELGRIAIDRTEPGEARSLLERSLAVARETGDEECQALAAGSLGMALVLLGEIAPAGAVLEEGRTLSMGREPRIRLDRARAALLRARGESRKSEVLLVACADEAAAPGYEIELARTLLQHGELLWHLGRLEEALHILARARSIAEARVARPLLARILLAKARMTLEPAP
jgi:tetratricopeptide (TPR) repeat protein